MEGENDLPFSLGFKISSVRHFHVAGNNPDKVNDSPDSTSPQGDEHEPPIGVTHHEAMDPESAQEKADQDHGDFLL